jgi:hypothetical protein
MKRKHCAVVQLAPVSNQLYSGVQYNSTELVARTGVNIAKKLWDIVAPTGVNTTKSEFSQKITQFPFKGYFYCNVKDFL